MTRSYKIAMIVEYFRPNTIEEALALLQRKGPFTIPLAGGTAIDRAGREPFAVVDLQALGLNSISRYGNQMELGAMVTLQSLIERRQEMANHGDDGFLPAAFIKAIFHEATYNLRQVATVGGTIVAADGCSPLTTALLAADAHLEILPGENKISVGDILPFRGEILRGKLITKITFPAKVSLAYEYVARTPADRPIVGVCIARWNSGRTRVALCGHGRSPMLAMDGSGAGGAEEASRSAYSSAGDEWASSEYRQEVAGVLTKRCLANI